MLTRYASAEMSALFSPYKRAATWRTLWIALAQAESEVGLPITSAQIEELKAHQHDIDFEQIALHEEKMRHDVMAHLQAFADLCPQAAPILHLGATSTYVTDNGDLLILKEALELMRAKLIGILRHLSHFAKRTAHRACLAYTHLQPAQPTTIGKRACLWIQDLLMDLEELEHRLSTYQFLGVKGATGTQASFLQLCGGDQKKVKKLEERVAELMGWQALFPIAGQTYTRKVDTLIVDLFAGIAASASKCAVDLRLLMASAEMAEPRQSGQVGSSAMPHKKNPILAERICSLARFVIALAAAPKETHANQWLERSLDDSAARRLYLSESALATDGILNLLLDVTAGLTVNEEKVAHHLHKALPQLAMEPILMKAVEKGGDRQKLHERLRLLCSEPGDWQKAIEEDPIFHLNHQEIHEILEPHRLIGRAPEQAEEFLEGVVAPKLQAYSHVETPRPKLSV
ncbi:MAG: adenylosuccinate lyase [Verrucomicrobia bacterium]|nr:adenylosuccinate lyase [Verrucomicrobiota bacterium]